MDLKKRRRATCRIIKQINKSIIWPSTQPKLRKKGNYKKLHINAIERNIQKTFGDSGDDRKDPNQTKETDLKRREV